MGLQLRKQIIYQEEMQAFGVSRVLDMGEVRPFRERKPPWFKVKAPGGAKFLELKAQIDGESLNTVCEEAACPNIGDCWDSGTAWIDNRSGDRSAIY